MAGKTTKKSAEIKTEKGSAKAQTTSTTDAIQQAFGAGATGLEVPEAVRSMAETSMAQARDAYNSMRDAAEDATAVFGESFDATRDNVVNIQYKTLDAARDAADATIDYYKSMLDVRSVTDLMELQASFMRSRFESFMDFAKDVQSDTVRFAEDASRPFQNSMAKTIDAA